MEKLKIVSLGKSIRMMSKRGASKKACERMKDMDPWTVTIRYKNRQLTTPFFMGKGHHGEPPTISLVLECLFSDASYADTSFEEFCDACGYQPNRKTRDIWNTIQRQTEKLKKLFRDEYEEIRARMEER